MARFPILRDPIVTEIAGMAIILVLGDRRKTGSQKAVVRTQYHRDSLHHNNTI